MNLTKELFDFLNSDYKTFHIREDNKYYDIAKIQHNSFIDLLFINSNNYHKTTIGDKFEYCGFYDNEKKQLYDINYTLRKDILKLDWDDKTYKSINDLMREINSKVCDTVNTYVEEYKEEFYEAAKDYKTNVTEHDVYQNFMDNEKEVKYECGYNSDNEQNVMSYFEYDEQHIYDVSLGYIETRKEYIGKQLIDIDKKNELLNEIYNNPDHEIHKVKEIVDIMKEGEYVNVHLFINKNGIDYDFKYNASILKNYWDYSYLPTWEIEAPDRREFKKLYGEHTDFYYKDIYKIEYRNKPIYEDKNFIKKEIEIEKNEDEGLVL